MNFFESFIHSLSGEMTTPTSYGWFHLMFVAFVVVGTIVLCVTCKNCSQKTYRLILLVFWIVLVLLEVYKQLEFSFEWEDGVAKWDYQWYAFPYQFCSTPLYVLPCVIFIKSEKIQSAFVSYLMTFSLFAGIVTFIYPNDVFISTIGINIQTMVHHGSQIVLGIFTAVYYRKQLNFKFFIKGIYVFMGAVALAMCLNLLAPSITDETFNMFYVSPHYDCSLPVLSSVYSMVPYIVFLLLYILGFTFVAWIVFVSIFGIMKLVHLCNKKFAKKSNK